MYSFMFISLERFLNMKGKFIIGLKKCDMKPILKSGSEASGVSVSDLPQKYKNPDLQETFKKYKLPFL